MGMQMAVMGFVDSKRYSLSRQSREASYAKQARRNENLRDPPPPPPLFFFPSVGRIPLKYPGLRLAIGPICSG